MDYDLEKVDEMVLALLYLTLHESNRAWKEQDWDVLNRLYEKGFIGNPVNKSKSVVFTEEGLTKSINLFQHHFGKSEETS